mmetsp:Transcript_16064/g.33727  ORF Transcript_16064/g.33727 Transcript_16064/m.33727 type:complete len:84 (-) Transcript_16064:1912-2163(-)
MSTYFIGNFLTCIKLSSVTGAFDRFEAPWSKHIQRTFNTFTDSCKTDSPYWMWPHHSIKMKLDIAVTLINFNLNSSNIIALLY